MKSIQFKLILLFAALSCTFGQKDAGDNACLVQNLKFNNKVDDLCIFNRTNNVPQDRSSIRDSFGILTKRKWSTLMSLDEQVNGNPENEDDEKNAAIIGGKRASSSTQKNIALIIVKTSNQEETYVCTGSILKKSKRVGLVLTSASCFFNRKTKRFIPKAVYVKPGIENRNKGLQRSATFFQVQAVGIKTGFVQNINTLRNDVAVVVIQRRQTLSFSRGNYNAIELPPSSRNFNIYRKDLINVRSAGWGTVKKKGNGRFANVLQEVGLVLRRKNICTTCYTRYVKSLFKALNRTQIMCARGERLPGTKKCDKLLPQVQRRGSCFGGDFGAPLFINRQFDPTTNTFLQRPSDRIFQVGVASFHDSECGYNSWYTNLLDEKINKDLRKIMKPAVLYGERRDGWKFRAFRNADLS